ncbi:MAG: BON domain-containing protein, partial [Coleofasciculaceae cyanobacterium SM2_3_26]|nr:BON domain-containing protein [Coleofasciculaceae cyanobacterium SM2_3_26]
IPALPPPASAPYGASCPRFNRGASLYLPFGAGYQQSITQLEQKVNHLEHQLYEPTELINPLLPLITELLRGHTESMRGEAFETVVPIIDQIIKEKSRQDRDAMASALAAIIPAAIAGHIDESKEELAQALGPAMGKAIQEQVRLERDAMVDALLSSNWQHRQQIYGGGGALHQPAGGKYPERGRTQPPIPRPDAGVSEAELILREAMHFSIKAIFLIHKASGLVIAEVQEAEGIREVASQEGRMEADMIAGMLTAIRSFANDCVSQSSGNVSELSEIEYDNFKIALEVAGYCYLAVVGQGDPPKSFVDKMRSTLVAIVQRHNKFIETYDGDSDSVPPGVVRLLEALMESFPSELSVSAQRKAPPALLIILVGILLGAIMLFGMWRYRETRYARAEARVREALASTPELAVYRLEAEAREETLTLSGNLPTESLRLEAERIAAAATDEFG